MRLGRRHEGDVRRGPRQRKAKRLAASRGLSSFPSHEGSRGYRSSYPASRWQAAFPTSPYLFRSEGCQQPSHNSHEISETAVPATALADEELQGGRLAERGRRSAGESRTSRTGPQVSPSCPQPPPLSEAAVSAMALSRGGPHEDTRMYEGGQMCVGGVQADGEYDGKSPYLCSLPTLGRGVGHVRRDRGAARRVRTEHSERAFTRTPHCPL